MTRLIGINGFKRSGKGETGAAIADLGATLVPGFTTTTLGFADKVKIIASKTLGFLNRSDAACIALMDEAKETWLFQIFEEFRERRGERIPEVGPWHDLTGREYLQNLGTQARKMFGDDFWVDQVLPKPNWNSPGDNRMAMDARYGTDCVAFTDLRFENEAKRILALGGEVWEVLRPGTDSDGHESEQKLPEELITRRIVNDTDLAGLRYEVEKALNL